MTDHEDLHRRWNASEDARVASEEAERMWPPGTVPLGRWDGITVTAEQSYAAQRQAYRLGVQDQWKRDRS